MSMNHFSNYLLLLSCTINLSCLFSFLYNTFLIGDFNYITSQELQAFKRSHRRTAHERLLMTQQKRSGLQPYQYHRKPFELLVRRRCQPLHDVSASIQGSQSQRGWSLGYHMLIRCVLRYSRRRASELDFRPASYKVLTVKHDSVYDI